MRSALLVALLGVSSVAAAADAAKGVLPFIDDDYGRAVAEAKQRKLPIFVEAWAPW
jgi:hypothetical protein